MNKCSVVNYRNLAVGSSTSLGNFFVRYKPAFPIGGYRENTEMLPISRLLSSTSLVRCCGIHPFDLSAPSALLRDFVLLKDCVSLGADEAFFLSLPPFEKED